MKIEKMQECDVNDVHKIEMDSFSEPWSKGSLVNLLDDKLQTVLVAKKEEKVVGYVSIYSVCKEVTITKVAVDKLYRRQGIAEALMNEVMLLLQKEEDEVVFLEVRKTNESAKNLYKKLGFEEYGERKNYYKEPTEDAILMRKILIIQT